MLLVAWHAKPAAEQMEKSQRKRARHVLQVSTQASKAREGETRAKNNTTTTTEQSITGLHCACLAACGPLRTRILLQALTCRRSGSPKTRRLTIHMAGCSYDTHWGGSAACLDAFPCCSPCRGRLSHRRHRFLIGLGTKSLSFQGGPVAPAPCGAQGMHSFEGSPGTSGYHGRLQSKCRTRDGGLRTRGSNFCGPSILKTLGPFFFGLSTSSMSISFVSYYCLSSLGGGCRSPPHRSH